MSDADRFPYLFNKLNKYRAALEYYAHPSIYIDQDNSCGDPECCGGPWPSIPVVDQDGGATARAALGIEDDDE